MTLYCPNCASLYEGQRCPACGKAKGRPPQDDDLCLLAEKGQIEADMLEDVLRQNGVPCLKQCASGAAMALYTGLYLATFQVLVPYSRWETAKEISDQFFSADCMLEQEAEDEGKEGENHEPDDD